MYETLLMIFSCEFCCFAVELTVRGAENET
jgi:hypothetical protein